MIFVTQRLDLGYTRVAGFSGYNSETKNFDEITPREVKELIRQGRLKGLLLKENEIILDKEGFNQMNLMIKSAVGKYRTLLPTSSIINLSYTVVRVIETESGKLYETINNRCGRVKINPERLKMLMQVGLVAGVRFNAAGEIEICDGVEIEGKQAKEKTVPIRTAEVTEPVIESEVENIVNDKSLIETVIDQTIDRQPTKDVTLQEVQTGNDSKENSSLNTIFTELDVNSIQEESTEATESVEGQKFETTELVELQKPDAVDANASDKSKSVSRNSSSKS